MALVDTLFQYGVRVRRLDAAGYTVLCDRYLPDALLDLRLRFPDPQVRTVLAAAEVALGFACPRPDVSLMLLLDRDQVIQRMAAKQEPFPDPPAIRDQRIAAYRQLADRSEFCRVDAGGTVEEVHQAVMSFVAGGAQSAQ